MQRERKKKTSEAVKISANGSIKWYRFKFMISKFVQIHREQKKVKNGVEYYGLHEKRINLVISYKFPASSLKKKSLIIIFNFFFVASFSSCSKKLILNVLAISVVWCGEKN